LIETLILLISTITIIHSLHTEGIWRTIQLFIPMTILSLIVDNLVVMNKRLFYGSDFTILIFYVPLCIGLGWSAIVYTTMWLTKHLLPQTRKLAWNPLIYGILGTSLDIILELMANEYKWWHWSTTETRLFIGPLRNSIGWFLNITLVALIFQIVTKKDWSEGKKTLILVALSIPLAILIFATLKAIGLLIPRGA